MNLNATFLGQVIAFAILIWFSYRFVWPPLVHAIEERQKKIADGLAAAERARKELADADARVADEIRKARLEASQIADRAHKQASEIVDKAKQDAIAEAGRSCASRSPSSRSRARRRSSPARSTPRAIATCSTRWRRRSERWPVAA
jgi:F-type H+-transporting ATPase subunit b